MACHVSSVIPYKYPRLSADHSKFYSYTLGLEEKITLKHLNLVDGENFDPEFVNVVSPCSPHSAYIRVTKRAKNRTVMRLYLHFFARMAKY